jgi:hypothetical protein
MNGSAAASSSASPVRTATGIVSAGSAAGMIGGAFGEQKQKKKEEFVLRGLLGSVLTAFEFERSAPALCPRPCVPVSGLM